MIPVLPAIFANVVAVVHVERQSVPSLFIGSSSEGRDIARNLQQELEELRICQVLRWDQYVFEASGYTIDSLVNVAERADFAVLVATPDDVVTTRGQEHTSVRDNVIFEFGLFIGALSRDRTYLLATGGSAVHLPSDLQGLTRLSFTPRRDNNLRAALNGAALQIEQRVMSLGSRRRDTHTREGTPDRGALDHEIDLLCVSAAAQGWTVKTNSPTTLRLRSPRGRSFTLAKGPAASTREQLRRFAKDLRAAGLRVNSSIRRPVADSPLNE